MARRSIVEDLLDSPWWVSLVVALIVAVVLKFILPAMTITHPVGSALARGSAGIATPLVYILLGISALSAIKSVFRRRKSRRLYQSQSSIDSIRALTWDDFERVVGQAFRHEGFQVRDNEKKGADRGIDLQLTKGGKTTLVQCKHWQSNKVTVTIIRELLGVIVAEKADAGIVVSTGSFTQPAVQFARENDIRIIDGKALAVLLSGQLPDFSEPEQSSDINKAIPVCPRCGGEMVERTARRGTNAGSQFLGCKAYPACRGTVSL